MKKIVKIFFAIGVILICNMELGLVVKANDCLSEFQGMAKISSYDVRKLTIGENTYGALERDPNDPRFYNSILYKITLSRSGKIDFTALTDFDGLRYAVLDKDGDEIRGIDSGKIYYNEKLGTGKDDFYFHFSKGTYYLQIYTTKSYKEDKPYLYFQIQAKFTDANVNEVEPNNNYSQATLLGREGRIKGQFSVDDSIDIYKIKVEKKTVLSMKYSTNEAYPYGIAVYDSNADEIFGDEYVNEAKSTYKVTLSPGWYYIKLEGVTYMGWGEHEMGNYVFDYSLIQSLGAKNVVISPDHCSYNNKIRNPKVIVRDNWGNILKSGVDYNVTVKGDRRSVGKNIYTVTFKGLYRGTAKKTFTINPAATRITRLGKNRQGVRVNWKKESGVNGYIVYRSTNGGAYKRIKTITSNKIGSYMDRGAIGRWTSYSYRIVVYKKVKGVTYKSCYSTAKKIYRY